MESLSEFFSEYMKFCQIEVMENNFQYIDLKETKCPGPLMTFGCLLPCRRRHQLGNELGTNLNRPTGTRAPGNIGVDVTTSFRIHEHLK